MIRFVNAKINLGLQIVRKREDGYHDLQTIFYPVGKYAGTAVNPERFCDILEISLSEFGKDGKLPQFCFSGNKIDCPTEKNLIYRAVNMFCEEIGADFSRYVVTLEKSLPDGAGMGGGSADAGFVLKMLKEIYETTHPEHKIEDKELYRMAARLGADCAFFLLNRPAYAEGIGDRLEEISLDLKGYWLVVVKPAIYVSTREAFSGVIPKASEFDLRAISTLPIEDWKELVKNDFEDSIFPQYPKIGEIKSTLYERGAIYASMSGSGSSVFGIFKTEKEAEIVKSYFERDTTIEGSYLLKL